MAAVLAQRGGSCSIVLTENMFFSSCITRPVSNALFFFSFLPLAAQVLEHMFAFKDSMCPVSLCWNEAPALQVLSYNNDSVKSPIMACALCRKTTKHCKTTSDIPKVTHPTLHPACKLKQPDSGWFAVHQVSIKTSRCPMNGGTDWLSHVAQEKNNTG